MIVFENQGEIDPRSITLIGVHAKDKATPIGLYGTGLKYGISSICRWGEQITIQSGSAEFTFSTEETEIRGKTFGIINMHSRFDKAPLGFTTQLGKLWEPWMVYRELWCNADDEPEAEVYETSEMPRPIVGKTRVIVMGPKIEEAHKARNEFILDKSKAPINKTANLEIYEGAGDRIFYRGIAVQKLDKPSLYTYNITGNLTLTEDRTASQFHTDWVIAQEIVKLTDAKIIDRTLEAPSEAMEARIDYSYAHSTSDIWRDKAKQLVVDRPLVAPKSVRDIYALKVEAKVCPTCGKPTEADEAVF